MDGRIKNKKLIVGVSIIVILIIAAMIFSKLFVIKTISIKGNDYYTEDEVKEQIFSSSVKNNTLLVWLDYKLRKKKEIPFIENYKMDMVSPSQLQVIVYEKNIIGYVEYMGSNLYFDRDGTVVESTQSVRKDIPKVVGAQMTKVVLREKIETNQENLFETVMKLRQLFQKYEMENTKICYNKDGSISVVIGDITAVLGEAKLLDGKIGELNDILPELKGLKGTLYLNNYTQSGTSSKYTFKKDKNSLKN